MGLNYAHLPDWLEDNKIFKKFFIFRKLFLSKVKGFHFSQFGEDISILRIFKGIKNGFFVDAGCFHPFKFNNTWQLYHKYGWRGVNIDIDPIKIDGVNVARPQDINIACAISNIEGEVEYFSNGFYSLGVSLDAQFANNSGYLKKTTQCKKLSRILDETKYKNQEIDFLSVDAEGHDIQVLESLDFERYNPKLIGVETHNALFSEVSQSPLYKFLALKGYDMVGWCGLTILMANKSLQKTLKTNS